VIVQEKGQQNQYSLWGRHFIYYPRPRGGSEVHGECILCQTQVFTCHWMRKHTEQQSLPLHNGFWIWWIFFCSIRFGQRWWKILNAQKCSWNDSRTNQLRSMLIDSRQALLEILRLDYQTTKGTWFQILMITTATWSRLAVHFGYRMSPTGVENKRKHTQSMLISPMWHKTYSLSYHMVLEWRPLFLLGKFLSAEGRQKPQARPFAKKLSSGSLQEPIRRYGKAMNQHWIWRKLKMTWKWRERRRNEICTQWQRSTPLWRCGRASYTYMLHRKNLGLKTTNDGHRIHFRYCGDGPTILVTLSTWWCWCIWTVRKITFVTSFIFKGPPWRSPSSIECPLNKENRPSSSWKSWG